MGKLIDLHIHSSYSDGDHTPEELVNIAKNKNISTISITDHDTVLAYHNLEPQDDIEIIPGIELSAKDEIGRMHILGYGIDPFNSKLVQITRQLRENSIESFLLIVDYLKDKDIIFNSKDISCLLNKNGDVSRNDLAKLCVDYGYAETVDAAFQEYLIESYLATKSKRKDFNYQECFEIIKNAGGVPVLAHPITLNRSDYELEVLIREMINSGLMGIEVLHSNHPADKIELYTEFVNKYNLLFSCGTDYHGEITKPDIEIGTGKQKKLVLTSCSVLDYVKSKK